LGGYDVCDTIIIRPGPARIAHDQAEHFTILAILVQDGLERRRVTRLVTRGIEFSSLLLEFGFESLTFFAVLEANCNYSVNLSINVIAA
jgi:hypothetical protein